GEQLARERADDVLRLSALQEVDDLIAEADRLWPATPNNIPALEEWLRRADRLVAELPRHEEKLAALRAKASSGKSEDEQTLRAADPRNAELEAAKRHLAFHERQRAAISSHDADTDPEPGHVGVDASSLPDDAATLNE